MAMAALFSPSSSLSHPSPSSSQRLILLFFLLILCLLPSSTIGWFQWDYGTQWSDESLEEAANKKIQWEKVWTKNATAGK